MTANGFTIIPNVAHDALERGVITVDMFWCLSLLFRWREHNSNVVRAVSAERIIESLLLLPDYADNPPSLRTIRRWMHALMEAGWFSRDYQRGDERPYNIFLRGLDESIIHHGQGGGEGRSQDRADASAEDRAKTAAIPIGIRHWKNTTAFQGRPESTSVLPQEDRAALPFYDSKSANNQWPSATDAAGLRAASAAGTIESPPSLLPPPVPSGEAAQTPPGLENLSELKATSTGKRKLLKALYAVAASELKNSHAVPATLKSRFELIEAAHGFEAVVEDFTKWCRENFDRHPQWPLVEYVKIVDDRLGLPSVPDTQSAAKKINPADDSRVGEVIRYVYNYSGIAPDVKKVASLIATYGYEYVYGVVDHAITLREGAMLDAKWVKTLFSESGGLAIITEYQQEVLTTAARHIVRTQHGKFDFGTATKFCLTLSPSILVGLYDEAVEYEKEEEEKKQAAKAAKQKGKS